MCLSDQILCFLEKKIVFFFKIGTFWMVQIFWESQWVCTYHRRLEPYISGMKLLVQLGTERTSFLSFCSMDDPLWCQSISINNTFWGHQYNNMLLLLLKKILINLQFFFCFGSFVWNLRSIDVGIKWTDTVCLVRFILLPLSLLLHFLFEPEHWIFVVIL